jgi:hypothetical protein
VAGAADSTSINAVRQQGRRLSVGLAQIIFWEQRLVFFSFTEFGGGGTKKPQTRTERQN